MANFAPCKAETPGLVEKDQVIKDFTSSNKYKPARVYTPSNKRQLVAAILEGESLNKKLNRYIPRLRPAAKPVELFRYALEPPAFVLDWLARP